ncbi:MAG TPA: hypothetical protein VES40_11970 [Ilumatobacteraceae bacterium]|nr:hypothetical protein [Ilumatobacteraceae bacterium]
MSEAQLRRLARDAIDEAEAQIDVDAAFAAVASGSGSSVRPVRDRGRRRRWVMLGEAAAVAALAVGAVVLLAMRDNATDSDIIGDTTASIPTTVVASTSTPPITSVAPPVVDPVPAESVSTTTPIAIELAATWSAIAATSDVMWESSGIARTCGMVWWEQQQMEQERCTELVVDPAGVPVSYDPTTRVVTRHLRDGGPVEFRVSDEYVDAHLIAAGPDDVVYFALDNEWPKSSDVLAVSVNRGDAGTVLERFPEVMGIGDADLFLTPTGLVLSGWYEQGPRPAPGAVPFVEWVQRDNGDVESSPLYYPGGSLDDAAGTVSAQGWQWFLGEDRAIPEGGTGEVLGTHDGGFIASYIEHDAELRTEVIRGFRDSSIEHWLLPGSWFELGTPVLEPQGTFLIPNGTTFARVTPFATSSNGWDGELQVDPANGATDAVGLNEYLDGIYASLGEGADGPLPWHTGPGPFANAIAGPIQPGEIRTIRVLASDGADTTVVVTTEGFFDDSVFGVQLTVHLNFTDAGLRVDHIDWKNTCQPNRGHQDYQAGLCT